MVNAIIIITIIITTTVILPSIPMIDTNIKIMALSVPACEMETILEINNLYYIDIIIINTSPENLVMHL